MLKWIFRKFWDQAPRMVSDSIWNHVMEDDATELIRHELERIADTLEVMRAGFEQSYERPIDVFLEMDE